jgi:DNA modification methylase
MHREKNSREILNILHETGWHFQNLIIWKKKTSAVPMKYRYGKHYQIIVFATKTDTPQTFNKLRIDPSLPSHYKVDRKDGVYVTDVWDDIRELTSGYYAGDEPLRDENNDRLHKQQTSLGILLRILLTSSKVNDVIFDPFSGTGTTLVTALQLQRYGIGVEKSPKNMSHIKTRLAKIRKSDSIERYYDYYNHTANLSKVWGKKKSKSTLRNFI